MQKLNQIFLFITFSLSLLAEQPGPVIANPFIISGELPIWADCSAEYLQFQKSNGEVVKKLEEELALEMNKSPMDEEKKNQLWAEIVKLTTERIQAALYCKYTNDKQYFPLPENYCKTLGTHLDILFTSVIKNMAAKGCCALPAGGGDACSLPVTPYWTKPECGPVWVDYLIITQFIEQQIKSECGMDGISKIIPSLLPGYVKPVEVELSNPVKTTRPPKKSGVVSDYYSNPPGLSGLGK